jgi:POT family proton-dependent oligopeptide transporter
MTNDALNKEEFFGHPKRFLYFFTEMWERFLLYGMKFVLSDKIFFSDH